MHWSRDYVGLPWAFAGRDRNGVDCWGLLWLIYRDVVKVEVASYAAETMDAPEREQIAQLLSADRVRSPWVSVEPGSAREFDMVVFRRGGLDSHIGIVVSPGRMLHIMHGGEARVESFDAGRWKAKLIGVHRHIELMERSDAA
ncbi:NlpC/P60 family protein [Tardiphaga sp.]|uniref:C40 family peptidase n=1 Tax=Tardiphaga sp. TaxID=1926292 RepID=UPI00262F2265|nr:NlpC/P60 family protein [Tardiphaga sp.]MDB5618474.1 putative tail assembly protein [Tardiphaga sp.]